MSLVACRECGQQVATSARVCPGCGVADPDVGRARASRWSSALVLAVLCVLGMLAYVALVG